MILFYKKAIQDILNNRFLNVVTIITIALSVLIVSAFALFFINASDIMNTWKKGIKLMVYLKPGITEAVLPNIQHEINGLYGVRNSVFISQNEALKRLKDQMKRQGSLFQNLQENPLPDAFEVSLIASSQSGEKVETLATRLEALPSVDGVEYGQKWLERFANVFELFRLTGYAMGGLFFMAAVFIVANTIRLVFYSRRDEIEIMRLVGAEDSFITGPFYVQGLIQGVLGGMIGLAALFAMFFLISSNVEQGFSPGLFTIRFLSIWVSCGILLGSILVGWIGCYLSLKRFLNI